MWLVGGFGWVGLRMCVYIYVYIYTYCDVGVGVDKRLCIVHELITFFDGYCSTVQGLLDWFEVELGFTELLFIQIDLCVMHCT